MNHTLRVFNILTEAAKNMSQREFISSVTSLLVNSHIPIKRIEEAFQLSRPIEDDLYWSEEDDCVR